MRMLKFYGRTLDGTMWRVKHELGEDALIVETREIQPTSATARLHPGSRYEITAALESPSAGRQNTPRKKIEFARGPVFANAGAAASTVIPDKGEEPVTYSELGKRLRLKLARSKAAAATTAEPAPIAPIEAGAGGARVPAMVAESQPSQAQEPARALADPMRENARRSWRQAKLEIQGDGESASEPRTIPFAPPAISKPATFNEDLGRLKAQVHTLLDEGPESRDRDVRTHADLEDYRRLIEQGVDATVLAHSFRRWLEWRAGAPGAEVAYTPLFDPDAMMEGCGLREWLWNEWRHQLNFSAELKLRHERREAPAIFGVTGATGVGKTTLLAKMASKFRLQEKKKVAIVSLDNFRVGANESWKRYAKLMDIELMTPVTEEDAMRCIESFERFDWIGLDTPGSMTPNDPAAKLFGFVLARCPQVRTSVVVDTSKTDRASREQISSMRPFRPSELIFSKIDEAPQRGTMVNLTFEEPWPVRLASTGRRVPEDLIEIEDHHLWDWVFEVDKDSEIALQGAAS